jgi:hypothetical protein
MKANIGTFGVQRNRQRRQKVEQLVRNIRQDESYCKFANIDAVSCFRNKGTDARKGGGVVLIDRVEKLEKLIGRNLLCLSNN